MPPRRSRANGSSAEGASTSAPLQIELESDKLAQGLASWATDGRQIVNDILTAQTSQDLDTTSTIPLSNTLIGLLQSDVTAEDIGQLLNGLAESMEEERKESLWEAFVDAVSVLVDDRDDTGDLKGGEMEVDGQAVVSPGAKGVQVVKSLLSTNSIPVAIPSLIFYPQTLSELGLLPYPHDLPFFTRATTKRSTALFYKQGKYNLLRESSEGFSGLIVLLTGADALSDDAQEETEEVLQARAKRVWSKVMGLIGYFNLSPPRVLDVILEIASCHVAVHWRFWLELIKCSPWGGQVKSGKGKEKANGGNWGDDEAELVAGVLDWEGDRVLAQVLGAKFSFCQRPDGGDTPRGLTYMAALLLKHGFVGLADLLPFLSPDDEEMENIRKRFIESTTSRSGPVNALSSTVLADDEPPSTANSKDAESTGPPAKPPPEQRIQLLQALLSLGDIPSAQYFLAKYPWLAQSHPAIGDLILRLIAHALEDVFRAEIPGFEDLDEDIADRNEVGDREVVPTLYAPSPPETSTKVFKFFYPGWRDGAEKWTCREDIHEKGMRWFSLVRGIGGRAGSVMAKICRIGTKHFALLKEEKRIQAGLGVNPTIKDDIRQSEPTPAEMEPWLNILRVLLLPALSNSNATAAFDIDLWALIKHFPYPVRYQLYGEWRDWTCDPKRPQFNCPIAVKAAAECTRDIKKSLSRVTASQSSTIPTAQERGPARALAKLSHTNPCALWSTAVTQVKAYPNIGASIVDAGRYMNQLAMDVATFTLVDVLASEKASRTNPQGTEVAQWLENIAAFVGDFNRRYLNMDLEPILQYIINKLMRGESDDLTILSRVIQRMYGVDTVENNGVSDAQLEAYGTGRQMIHESFWTTQILLAKPTDDPGNKSKSAPMDKAKSTKKSLPRLISALRETKLAIPIWIALAQTRQGVVDKLVERQPDTPLKALGLMHDKVHDIFIQYGDLLSEQLTPDELINYIPDFATLTNDFGLDYNMAFQVLRSRLHAQITREDDDKLNLLREKLKAQKEATANATGTLTPPISPTPITPPLLATDLPVEGFNGDHPNGGSVPEPKPRARYQPALLPTIEQAGELLTESAKINMGAPFFVVFWNLSTSDISFSASTYKSAISRISAYDKEIASWRGGNLSQQNEERKRLKDRVAALTKEQDMQSAYVERTRKRLRLEAPTWFDRSGKDGIGRQDLALQLHQFCFYPRVLLTPSDAVFVAKMIRTMHDLGTDGFSTVLAYMQFFGDSLPACIFACTESEARNLARCLKAMLVDLDIWHNNQKKYEAEGTGDPASPLPGMLYRQKKAGEEYRLMSWQAFRVFNISNIHSPLFKAIKSCWQQTDFMHIKNGITVALQVLPIFPLLEDHGKELYSVMEKLSERADLTPDLKQGCKAYMVQLQKRITVRPYLKHEDYSATPRAPPTPAKVPPSGPSKAEDSGKTGTAPIAPAASAKLDQEALRQRVKESKMKQAASVKEERRSAPPVAPTDKDEKDKPSASHPPPAGPRATRSTGSVPPPAPTTSNGNGPSDKIVAPTGPSRTASNTTLPQRPGQQAQSMGPPKALTADEERAAARARRFGSLVSDSMPIRGSASPAQSPAPSPRGKEGSPMAPPSTSGTKREDEARPKSPPLPPSRKSSPGTKKRSNSIESRTSERSRRDHRERDRGGRDDRRKDSRATTPDAKVEEKGGDKDRNKQEDLLQARHDKLAGGEERRSSSSRKEKETEKERADRKAREKEEKAAKEKDEAGGKRKRDEAPRRIDPVEKPGDRRREREREESSRRDDRDRDRHRDGDRDRDRDTRDRRSHRHDDPRDRDRDRRDDPAHRDRERGGDRRDDPRGGPRRDDPRDRRPDERDRRPDERDRRRDDPPRELLPSGPARDGRSRPSDPPLSISSVEQARPQATPSAPTTAGPPAPAQGTSDAPRNTRSNDVTPARGPHALPARPGSRNDLNTSTNSINTVTNTSIGSNGGTPSRGPVSAATPGSLASRMGMAISGNASPSSRPASPPLPPPAGDSERKRPHDAVPMGREGSADSKRPRIDRERGRRPKEGANRMLAGAMKAANDKPE